MKKSPVILGFVSVLLFSICTTAIAQDLVDIFNLARKNDAQWASKKQKYMADREKVEQAYGTLLPTAEANATWAKQQYDGQTFDPDIVQEIFTFDRVNCWINNSNNPPGFDACSSDLTATTASKSDYEVEQYGVTITQPLIRMDRWHRYKRAQMMDNGAKADLALAQQELIIRTSEAYFGVLKAQEELRLAEAEEKMLRTQLTEIKNRYRLGLMRDTDLFEIQAQYDLASAGVIVIQAQLDGLKENLTLLTGQPIELVSPLPKNIPVEPPQPLELAEWEEFAKRNNYQLLAAQFISQAAEKEITEKKAGHAPTADLFFDYRHSDVGGGFTPSSDTTTFGVRFAIPLYTGGITSSQTKEAQYRSQSARDDVELARRNAIRETRQYHTRVMADVASVNARLRAVKSNNSSLRTMKEGWKSGLRTMTDVLSSQRKVFQARKEYSNARYDYILNTLKLKKAAGVLTPEDLRTLNSWLDAPSSDTVSSLDSDENLYLEEIDDIKFKQQIKTFEDDNKPAQSHKSLYDAFKSWRKGDGAE
jgi:outer membrane protein